jgi:hypothetical protein
MTNEFEYITYFDGDQLTMLENTAIPGGVLGGGPAGAGPAGEGTGGGGAAGGGRAGTSPRTPGGRTEALINRGRPPAGRSRARGGGGGRAAGGGGAGGGGWVRTHLRAIGIAAAIVGAGIIALVIALPGGGAGWPASVAQVQTEITQACENTNVAAEPSQLNFACAKSTQSILWVFSLLTSGNNPSFVDQATGRKGLEPIQPAQGGDIAFSLNLHQPYNAANPIDSLQVAARAINDIISGATLTSSSGAPLVENGLESTAANCQRYTGSALLVTRSGYPPRCAQPVSTPTGQAALVSDVFQQWMGGTPSQMAAQAGVLFANADNPGNPQVQAILASLPSVGL